MNEQFPVGRIDVFDRLWEQTFAPTKINSTAVNPTKCVVCGGQHELLGCPQVAEVEYHPTGGIKFVRKFPQ